MRRLLWSLPFALLLPLSFVACSSSDDDGDGASAQQGAGGAAANTGGTSGAGAGVTGLNCHGVVMQPNCPDGCGKTLVPQCLATGWSCPKPTTKCQSGGAAGAAGEGGQGGGEQAGQGGSMGGA